MDKNDFGGGNRHSLYVPLSELEQEALSRLVESGDLRVHVVDWGVVNQPRVLGFGDARLTLGLRLEFDRPALPMDVYFLELELRTGSGYLLCRHRESLDQGGKPMAIAAGLVLEFEWHLQIHAMDPELVKALVPHARGLTSRLQDKDTKEFTLTGNMKLDDAKKKKLVMLREGERFVREDSRAQAARSKAKQEWRGPRPQPAHGEGEGD